MSHSANKECDDKIKNIIHHLYKVKNLPLQGSDKSVMAIMKQKYGFDRTKQQYETLLSEWGYKKKRKREDYQIVEWQVQKRRKESAVYLEGKLVPMKTRHRQGSMTVPERMKFDDEMPETPTGFEIRTPTAQSPCNLTFWNLPILQFGTVFDVLKEAITISEQEFNGLLPFETSLKKYSRSTIVPSISRILPIEALQDEPIAASALAINRMDNLGSGEFLTLAIYLMSNNFIDSDWKGKNAYAWLKARGSMAISGVIRMISSRTEHTAKALLENIFRLAVEAGDTTTVKLLLETGINPNGHRVCYSKIPDTMDPLHLACITRNFDLARVLIAAGSNVHVLENQSELCFWKRSLIVLAIVGENEDLETSRDRFANLDDPNWGYYEWDDDKHSESNISGEFEDASSRRKTKRPTQQNLTEEIKFQFEKDSISFLKFIGFLIKTGAQINLKPAGDLGEDGFAYGFPVALQPCHSPLTAASKYRHGRLVQFLLANGADVRYITRERTCALQECLSGVGFNDYFRVLNYSSTKKISIRKKDVLGIVHGLLHAGTEVDVCSSLGSCDSDHADIVYCKTCEYYSALDLAVMIGSTEVLEVLFKAGGRFSTNCLQHAITYGNIAVVKWLVDRGATVPFEPKSILVKNSNDRNIRAVLKRCSNRSTKRFAMLTAIKFDSLSLMDCVLALGPFDWTSLFEFPNILHEVLKDFFFEIADESFDLDSNFDPEDNVISRILDQKCAAVYNLWPILNLAVNVSLYENEPSGKNLSKVRRIYGNFARTTLQFGLPMYPPMAHRKKGGHYEPFDPMLTTAINLADNKLVVELIDAGVNINSLEGGPYRTGEFCYQTPLTTAIKAENWKAIDYLLEAGVHVNSPFNLLNELENSALCAAIDLNNAVLVQRLLDRGARFDWQATHLLGDDCKISDEMFHFDWDTRYALGKNYELSCMLLTHLQGVLDPSLWACFIEWMLSIAVEFENLHLVRTILAMQKQGSTLSSSSITRALSHAVVQDDSSDQYLAKFLLGAGTGADEGFPLMNSGTEIPTSFILHEAVSAGRLSTVEVILKAGGDPNGNLNPPMESTALQMAIEIGKRDIVHVLLQYNANPNASSPYQRPLYPLRWGTPLQLAVEGAMEDSVELLLEYKADLEGTNSFVLHTPLQIAARKGFEFIVNMLIENGANINAPPAANHGATALQYAVIGGFFGIAYVLVQNGADVNATPAEIEGRTALEGAAEHGRIDLVKFLLNAGAVVHDSGERQYNRALEFATSNGHHSIRELLEEHHG